MKSTLNVIIYGKNILADINHLINKVPSIDVHSKFKNTHYFIEEETNWTYFLIQSEYNKKAKDIIEGILKDHYKEKFKINFFDLKDDSEKAKEKNILLDTLIICVDKLEDKDSKEIFKDIQNYSRCTSKLPFVIFLTKKENKPDIEQYWELITNSFFDRRNIFAYKFPSRPEERSIIYEKLTYFCNYYNSRGSTDTNKNNSLNILIAGQAGAGKSTLQNLLQGEKIAREGEGESITFRISFYTDKRYNITKIDCPGFENEKTVTYVRNMIKDLRNKMISTKDHIDCVIYLIKSTSDRIFYDMEKEFIKELIQYKDMDVIFCANTFGKEEESDEYYKNKEIIEDCLVSMIREIPNLSEERQDKIIDSIVYVNLVKRMKGKEVSVNIYGIDKLLSKMYDLLSIKTIDEAKLKKAKDLNELIKITEEYSLLKMYKEKGDFRMKNRIDLSKYILSRAKKDFWKNFFIFGIFDLNSCRKEMIKHIIKQYEGKVDETVIDQKYAEINEELGKQNWKKNVEDFFESMKDYKTIFEASGFDFNAKFYNEYTIAIGLYLIKKYEENSYLFNKNSFNLILELAKGLNNGIQGLNKLSEEWEEIINDIKEGKSDIEWVRRFFKLDKKE